ncbi:MAG: hypothetical protein HY290_21670 [Planctomycetia bacterium]|nr:hypothetical protein [Planctomycetia bacterium]
MRRTLLGLTALLVITGVLLVEESQAGRRRKCCNPCYPNTCCAPAATCCAPQSPSCGEPTRAGPYFCNTILMMPGTPDVYQGNRFPDGDICANPTMTLCSGDGSTCGGYPQNCDATHPPKNACTSERKGPISPMDYVFISANHEGDQIVQSGKKLQTGHKNKDADNKRDAAKSKNFAVKFDGYWYDPDEKVFMRLMKMSREGYNFYVGFEVEDDPGTHSSAKKLDTGCTSYKLIASGIHSGGDWKHIREVTYTGGESEIDGKTFVVVTVK